MAIAYEIDCLKFDGVVYDNDGEELLEYLKKSAPLKIKLDLSECEDMHTVIIQLISAYKLNYECEILYKDECNSAYKKAIEGSRLIA